MSLEPNFDGPGGALRNVVAAVVTYNPDTSLGPNLEALRAQVDTVLVIDNGSTNIAFVERTVLAAGCRMVANMANLGIASALSQAARLAQSEGFDWLATFDQDSLIRPRSIAGLLKLYEAHPQRDRIGVLAMARRDRGTGRDYHFRWDILEETPVWRSVRTTITSGSLVRVTAFETVGFCLRCRSHGLLVIEGLLQVMDHSVGNSRNVRLFWLRVSCANQNAMRRYYITRNQLEVLRRYFFSDFVWCFNHVFLLIFSNILVIFYEQHRLAKVGATLAGVRDFLLRRFGPRQQMAPSRAS